MLQQNDILSIHKLILNLLLKIHQITRLCYKNQRKRFFFAIMIAIEFLSPSLIIRFDYQTSTLLTKNMCVWSHSFVITFEAFFFFNLTFFLKILFISSVQSAVHKSHFSKMTPQEMTWIFHFLITPPSLRYLLWDMTWQKTIFKKAGLVLAPS